MKRENKLEYLISSPATTYSTSTSKIKQKQSHAYYHISFKLSINPWSFRQYQKINYIILENTSLSLNSWKIGSDQLVVLS